MSHMQCLLLLEAWCCVQGKRGCDATLSAAAVSNQRQRLLDKLSAFFTSCDHLKCLLCEQQKFMGHVAELQQADTVRVVPTVIGLLHSDTMAGSQVIKSMCAMQVTKQQLEEKEVHIAELKTLCEQQKVCFSTLRVYTVHKKNKARKFLA